ncbi:ABC transporter ATP-binding protein [Mycobacterium sp. NPDC003449]
MGLDLDGLKVSDLAFGYGDARVLRDVSLPTMRPGEVTAVVGPNAAGKSTLLKRIAGIHRGSGRVEIGGDRAAKPTERILYTPQDPPPPSSITVFEAVLLARQGRLKGRPSPAALDEIGRVLAELDLDEMSTRAISDLSGGQRQLVSLAQAMIRRPAVMLLDEPTSSLDLRNQLQLLALVRRIAREQPAVVMITVHDLGLAARFADRIVVLSDGAVHSAGDPGATITEAMLREVYRIDGQVHTSTDGVVSVAAARSL